jgi:preprotein translocase subunit YajC
MNDFGLFLLMGAPGGTEGGAAGGIMSFVPFILIIAIFYFLIIRPQNKKQKETQKMLNSLRKGDKIITAGGIHGTITKVKESSVIVRVDDNVNMEFSRGSISTVSARVDDDEDEDEKDGKSEESGKTAALPEPKKSGLGGLFGKKKEAEAPAAEKTPAEESDSSADAQNSEDKAG